MKLSRTSAYAVQAMICLAESDTSRPVPCSRLAQSGHMPERFLLQILRGLVTRGVLHSTRGVEGGYALTRPPQEITLLDIIEAVEGPLDAELPEGVQTSPEDAERLRKALGRVVQATKEQMSAIKLSDLAGKLGNPVASSTE